MRSQCLVHELYAPFALSRTLFFSLPKILSFSPFFSRLVFCCCNFLIRYTIHTWIRDDQRALICSWLICVSNSVHWLLCQVNWCLWIETGFSVCSVLSHLLSLVTFPYDNFTHAFKSRRSLWVLWMGPIHTNTHTYPLVIRSLIHYHMNGENVCLSELAFMFHHSLLLRFKFDWIEKQRSYD